MHRRAKGWSLWISAAIVLAGAAATAFSIVGHRRAHSPRTDAHLHLPIGDLRSQAEEGRLLVRIARADELTTTFTREHARQLARRVHAALDDLPAATDVSKPGTDAAIAAAAANDARRARRAGENVERALQRMAAAPRPADELDLAEPVFAAAARELGFLDTATREPAK